VQASHRPYEENTYDEAGQRCRNLADSLLTGAAEMRRSRSAISHPSHRITNIGMKAWEEGGPCAPAAIANAIRDALAESGPRSIETPITPRRFDDDQSCPRRCGTRKPTRMLGEIGVDGNPFSVHRIQVAGGSSANAQPAGHAGRECELLLGARHGRFGIQLRIRLCRVEEAAGCWLLIQGRSATHRVDGDKLPFTECEAISAATPLRRVEFADEIA